MKKKNGIALLCAAAMTMTLIGSAGAVFRDVDETSELGEAVAKLEQIGAVGGYPDGTFGPERTLTRAEFVKVANLTFGLSVKGETAFPDVTEDQWFYDQVRIAVEAGYIKGADGLFLPDKELTREEFCAMVGRINHYQNILDLEIPITDKVSDWAREEVENAIACGLFTLPEDGKFRATEPITRAEMAQALAQYANPEDKPDPDQPDPDDEPDPEDKPDPDDKPGGGTGGGIGGGTGGGTGGGIGGGTGGNQPTESQKREEAEVAGYLAEIIETYQSMNIREYTGEARVMAALETLMGCLQDALSARQSGVFLTQDFIRSTYAATIEEFRSLYGTLSQNERNDIQVIVGNLAPSYKLEKVMNYFGVSL